MAGRWTTSAKEKGTMPRTKKQAKPTPPSPQLTPAVNGPAPEVFTLSEAAAYLRLSEADVLRLVEDQHLPARQLGKEWRFLKAAIQDWLRAGPPPKPSREAQLAAIGSWKDDPYLEEMLKEIYRQRGRSMTEEDE
jgi:excisionase family DNA binding protein